MKELPPTSVGRLYANICRSLICRLDEHVLAEKEPNGATSSFDDGLPADLWIGDGWLESVANATMAPHSMTLEQLMFDNSNSVSSFGGLGMG